MEPIQLPVERSSGGRARALLVARYVVYVVIIAVGGFHLLDRDTASGEPPEPPGAWASGQTTQRLPVEVKVDRGRVVALSLSWHAPCSGGGSITWRDGFVDAHRGDFARDGTAFRDDWEVTNPIRDGFSGRLKGQVQGESAGGVTRGSVDFKLEVLDGDRLVETCESGPIGYAIDLPTGGN